MDGKIRSNAKREVFRGPYKFTEGPACTYALMYNTLGGHPYKKPIYYNNTIM